MKSVSLINATLALLCVGLAILLFDTVKGEPDLGWVKQHDLSASRPSAATVEQKSSDQTTAARRPQLSDYDLVMARNMFKDPNPPPPPQKAAVPPPTVPLPTLVGVVFVGDEGKAILKSRERQEIYGVGDAIAGGRIAKIEADRVVINFANRSSEVLLKSSLKKVAPPASSVAQAGQSQAFTPVSPSAGQINMSRTKESAEDKPTRRSDRLRRLNERLELQREEIKR